jgi:hypothetical protein
MMKKLKYSYRLRLAARWNRAPPEELDSGSTGSIDQDAAFLVFVNNDDLYRGNDICKD